MQAYVWDLGVVELGEPCCWSFECVCVYVPKGAAMLLYFNMLGNIYINVHGSLAMQM